MKPAVKYYGLCCLFLSSFFSGYTQIVDQDSSTREPFFKAKHFNSKCYVGIEGGASQMLKTKAGMISTFSLNWVINHKFVVSAKYYGLTTPLNVQKIVAPDRSDTINLRHQFAGLAFSYILFDNKKFSLQPELAGGWGMVKFGYANTTYRKDFAEFIPGIYGTYNVTKYFRFGVGLNYRITAGASTQGLKDGDVSGLGGFLFIKVGTF